jgi:hypothetical protein
LNKERRSRRIKVYHSSLNFEYIRRGRRRRIKVYSRNSMTEEGLFKLLFKVSDEFLPPPPPPPLPRLEVNLVEQVRHGV